MAYNRDKLTAFENAVLEDTDSKIAELEREVRDYEQAELDKAKEDEYNKMFTYMQDQVQVIKAKYRQAITKFELESKRNLLVFRNELTDRVFEAAKERLAAFRKTKDYEAFLTKKIKQAFAEFPCDSAVVLVNKDDLAYAAKIKAAVPGIAELEADHQNHLGGFKLVNREKGLLADETFAAALEQQKQAYYTSCGLSVHF